MPTGQDIVSSLNVSLARTDLARMIRLVRDLHRLSRLPGYRAMVLPEVPETARFDPGHDSVMMGYDFHLSEQGPRLIEVNTNAGGGMFAFLAYRPDAPVAGELPRRLRQQLLHSFADEMRGFSGGGRWLPEHIAIVDEKPREQFLYPEMQAFANLFEGWGARASVVDPAELVVGADGVSHLGRRVDLIYNRHCDFYLERPEMAGIRAAYLARQVCLTPNPFSYGLLADKRRMILWSDPEALAPLGLGARVLELLAETVPCSRLLANLDAGQVWAGRKDWVFKPVSRFGSRGVLLGRKISRARFEELDPADTLVQRLVLPSLTDAGPGGEMKTDFRLYVYRDRVLGVAARLYQGQVTNLRTPGGGFAPVRLV
ncbi:hypothetical protein DESUT3_03900 [Desulfuromonas versatilis]|uniref:Circularly permuted type 2 ATP-grasp protein n=1 Tax=Desulfuromonas versatilis TaxID=2802975 RepID=A0ABN6DTH7_9BACT|nr:hypothetical protein [Desulfuromonas versatilis]BCR03321.1 hypothetical protein DESUT3_03900 [Desulfuromonas versatilis]